MNRSYTQAWGNNNESNRSTNQMKNGKLPCTGKKVLFTFVKPRVNCNALYHGKGFQHPPDLYTGILLWVENREVVTLQVQIHSAILRAMAELHRVSTPKFVACNIAAVESRPTSATLRATNFFVYPPSAAFWTIVWHKFQCSANQISHSNLTADLIFACGTFHIKRWFGL